MPDWHEDDSFWETFFPGMFGEEVMLRAVTDVDGVAALAEPPEGASVLDLCCGPGRHSLELARRGFRVTGVDRTAAYLDRARSAALAEGLSVEFVLADARDFTRPGAFDLAINLYTSFGYFEDPEDDPKVARALFDSLRPGGKLVMEMMGKEVLARIFQPNGWEERDGVLLLQERRVTDDWGWMENRWLLIRDGQVREQRLGHRLYSASELKALLRSVGFSEARAFGNLAGDPYDHQARRLVILATR
jgi:SAM-dependent methyltransferase